MKTVVDGFKHGKRNATISAPIIEKSASGSVISHISKLLWPESANQRASIGDINHRSQYRNRWHQKERVKTIKGQRE